MDHLMPDMDGIEAAVRIRGINGHYKAAPIVALTANALTGMREMYLANGFDDFLAKPVEVPKLYAVLETHIPKEKQQQAAERVVVKQPSASPQIMRVFREDCIKRLADIPQYLKQGDTKQFITAVHALKSASANVGEMKLSELAAKLETAAKRNDAGYITVNLASFLLELQKTIDGIPAETLQTVGELSDEVIDTLLKLKTALTDIDISAIDEIMAKLEKSNGEVINELARCVLVSDYEGAKTVIDRCITNNQT